MKSLFIWLKWIILGVLVVQGLTAPVDTWNEQEEDHELIGGYFQGDMEVEFTRNGEIAESRKWPNGVVHFKIDEVFDADHTAHILRALQTIEEVSCIRFIPASGDMTAYLHFIGEPSGCHTKVGYRGKLQTLNLQVDPLDKGCFKLGTIMHEVLHSLGFHHQQCASDRDDFVRIVEENIKDGKESNFKKYDENTVSDFGIQYDYGSILHYSSTAFSKNGEKTIVPLLGEDIEIGQRRALSSSDIAKLNLMYQCPVWVK
ncbi:seminal metalloprotease 1 [Stomoxys calcitrans]|uniref:seminal metalloprotease 1 n=1 Tax=Stomoxys calcitrans TaxID=35570 RepID=UPI0027E2CB6B|nr:seminal metalloprotease 1 [Stomoxys calcitrans]